MKKTNKFLSIFMFLTVAILGSLLLVACSCNDDQECPDPTTCPDPSPVKEATAYGIVHKDYVGTSHVVVVSGKVVSVTFDEVFLPYSWAALPADTALDHVEDHAGKVYAKYIKIGDKLFTGTLYGTDAESANAAKPRYTTNSEKYSSLNVKYSAEGIADLYAYIIASSDNGAWYVQQAQLGNIYIANASGTKVAEPVLTNGSFFKSSSDYWTASNYPIGWARNLQFLGRAIVGTNMSTAAADVNKVEGYINIGSTVTQATLTDAADYYAVAKAAFTKANA